MRLDKFLKVSRVIKRRTVASEACAAGRVQVNGKQAKAGTQVKPGDKVKVDFAGGSTEFEVLKTEETVNKAGAAEMYRIITSVIVAVFLCLGTLGLSSCKAVDGAPAGKAFVGIIGEQKIYEEQYGYLFLQEAKEEAGFEISEEWIKSHEDQIIQNTNRKCVEMCVLTDSEYGGKNNYSDNQIQIINNETDTRISALKNKEEYKDWDTKDEVCRKYTGMNVNEYKRFTVFRGNAENAAIRFTEELNPDANEIAKYYADNKERLEFRSVTYVYKKTLDDEGESNKEEAEKILELCRSGPYDFETVAKGWSDASDVRKTGGVAILMRNSTGLPGAVVKWAFESDEASNRSDAELIEADNGFYIVKRNETPGPDNEAMFERLLLQYQKDRLKEYVEKLAEETDLKITGFEEEKTKACAEKYLQSFLNSDYENEELPEESPEPTKSPFEAYSFAKPSDDSFCKIGDEEMYSSDLACAYMGALDALTRQEPDYKSTMSLEEFLELRKKVSGEHKEELLLAAFEETKKIYIGCRELYKDPDAAVSEEKNKQREDEIKSSAVSYYEILSAKNNKIDSPDKALIYMSGASASETARNRIKKGDAERHIIDWLYEFEITNKDVKEYYNSNINKYRRVDTALAFVHDEETAKEVCSKMQTSPEDAANVAAALGEEPKEEKISGLVYITASTKKIPGAVRAWAYRQTKDSLITENGKAEVIKAGDGYYAVACVEIHEYSEELDSKVYREVCSDYKEAALNKHFEELMKSDEYKIKDLDRDKMMKIADGCVL